MVNYEKGEYIWAKSFIKSPKKKVQSRYLTEPLEVIKDFGYAILVKNHLGIVTKLHKNNVKKYTPRNLELYNALPFKFKLKLGSNFDSKELNKYFDELQKEEPEKIELLEPKTDPKAKNISDPATKTSDDEVDTDSDEEDKLEKSKGDPYETKAPNDLQTKARQPNVPFHMNLRDRKVRFN